MKEFNLMPMVSTEKVKVGKREIEQLTKTYINAKGEETTIILRDKADIENALALEILAKVGETAGLGVCYELSICNPKSYGCKNIGEVGERFFSIAHTTANQYARIGKHFVKKTESEKGVNYVLIDLVAGVTRANLNQILSLVDEKADNEDDALKELTEAILPDENGKVKINLYSPLSELKKQIKAYKSGVDEGGIIADVEPKEISSEKASEENADFTTILKAIERLTDDKKVKALELVAELQDLLA